MNLRPLSIVLNGRGPNTFAWVIQPRELDLTYSNVYFLFLSPDGSDRSENALDITSAYFNLTESALPASQTTLTTTSTASTNMPGPNSSLFNATSSETSETLSSGARAGIGVGTTLACLLIIASAFHLYRRRKKMPGA